MNKSLIIEQCYEGPQSLKAQTESQIKRQKCGLKNILELTQQENEANFENSDALGKQQKHIEQQTEENGTILQRYMKCISYLWKIFAPKPKMKYVINHNDIQKKINKIKRGRKNAPAFITKKSDDKPVLVLDLDETLVFTSDKKLNKYDHQMEISFGKIKNKVYSVQRFGLSAFLFEISLIYEIVLFTAGHRNYAEKIIAQIDPKKRISHVLCREHCIVVNGSHYMKNIRSLGRDMSKIVIVDDNAMGGILQPQNFYKIQPFRGNEKDRKLVQLINFLKFIHQKKCYTPIDELRKQFLSMQIEVCSEPTEAQSHVYQNLQIDSAYSILIEGEPPFIRKGLHKRTNSEIQCISKEYSQKDEDEQATADGLIK